MHRDLGLILFRCTLLLSIGNFTGQWFPVASKVSLTLLHVVKRRGECGTKSFSRVRDDEASKKVERFLWSKNDFMMISSLPLSECWEGMKHLSLSSLQLTEASYFRL